MVKKVVEYKLSANKCEFEQKKIMSSSDVYDYAKQFYSDDLLIYESSFIVLINRANKVLGYAKISQGGVAGTVVDTKIVAKYAIESLYNPQIQISAESETKRSIFREKDKTKRSKKESAQHSKSRNKSFVMTSVSAL